ncbi:methyltransferase domain-containing protein [Ditylenchus destructor]|uniref:Methyltransferase domain-containing protein n=1 Tax=Ditylenchus destructor TaxID=166010 RepID=A0AAD4QZT0_9BILA|nr:methyltransferase domain-containing protein [Ditylenchus destructor]
MEHLPADEYLRIRKKKTSRNFVVNPTLKANLAVEVKGKRVLDVGCGNGSLTLKLVEEWGASEAIGVDTSAEMIIAARSSNPDGKPVTFVRVSALDLQSKDEFEVAIAIFMLQLTSSVEELSKVLQKIAQSLKPGGAFFAYVPNGIPDLKTNEEDKVKFGFQLVMNPGPRHDGEQIKIAFYINGRPAVESTLTFFFRETYEKCLREAGFGQIQWINPIVSEDGITACGKEFFESYLNPPIDIMFRAVLEAD